MILSMEYSCFDITTIMAKMISMMKGRIIYHLWPFIIEYHHLLMICACLGLLAIGASCLFVSQSMHHCLFKDWYASCVLLADCCISWSLAPPLVHLCGLVQLIVILHSLVLVAWCRVVLRGLVLCGLVQSHPSWLGAKSSFAA